MGQSLKRGDRKSRKSMSGQKTKLEKLGLEKADISIRDLRKSLKLGRKYAEEENWEKALPPLLAAWEAMPEDMNLLTVIAQGLVRLGVREYAIEVLERALTFHEPNEDICTVMMTLAVEMEMFDIAVKVGMQLITMNPTNPKHYVNLATAYTGVNKLDESISMLQEVLPLFPENSDLWNVLATQVRERDGVEASNVFFEEAIRLAPRDIKVISNYAMSFVQTAKYKEALELNMRAIEVDPSVPEPHIGAGQLLFLEGAMEQGWEHYKHRLNTRRKQNQTQVYTHDLEEWQGQDLTGKTLLVCAEQGIGDEVMFGNYLPFLYERAEKLVIGCERRLVSLYKRRFPNAFVDFYLDQFNQGYRFRSFPNAQNAMRAGELQVDFAVPLATAPSFEWTGPDAIKCHPEGFLNACPERKKEYEDKLNAISDKPKVGLAWRSGVVAQQRAYLYSSMEMLGPILKHADKVDFINLQYGDVSAEIALAQEMHGVKIHTFDDMDLKGDIEANIAIMANIDLMVSACSAPGMFALSSGCPTILMSAGPPWWCFGREDRVSFAKDAEFIVGGEVVDWPDILGRVSTRIADRLNLS